MKTIALQSAPALSEANALHKIARNAAEADAGTYGLAGDMASLVASGILARLCSGTDPRAHVTLLRRIGRASLSVGRLAEGHTNALKLVALYGSAEQRRKHGAAATAGIIYGVWGADDETPVQIAGEVGGRLRLTGGKRFASGLGTVGRAVVTATTAAGPRLAIAEVGNGPRADASVWDTSGMRATVSGRYDFDGVEAEALGDVGDYLREPHFEGGVWRYAAVHVGGLEALAEDVRNAVGLKHDAANEAQLHRVANIITLVHSARLIVEDAAMQVETQCADAEAVALSLAAREAVEDACLRGMAIADRALGTRSFAVGQRAERVRRDLAFFLRQANLDGKLRQVGQTLCRSDTPVGELWSQK